MNLIIINNFSYLCALKNKNYDKKTLASGYRRPDVRGYRVSNNGAIAGRFISAYAIGVVVGAPTLIALAAEYNPKKILLFFMVLFTLFNGLSAFSPDYTTLLLARFFSGLPHGAFFGVGAIVAKQLAPKGKEAFAISIMFAGLTVANLVMIPLLTYVGALVGWRIAMGCVSYKPRYEIGCNDSSRSWNGSRQPLRRMAYRPFIAY